MTKPQIILVTGVAGAGKTSVGRALADRLGRAFIEGDDFHDEHNIAKMSRGEPLTDRDRAPWLDALRRAIEDHMGRNAPAVVAVSALRAAYRERLHADDPRVLVVLLDAPAGLLARRLAARRGHFFDEALLDSQLETLERPVNALVVPADLPVDEIVERIAARVEVRG